MKTSKNYALFHIMEIILLILILAYCIVSAHYDTSKIPEMIINSIFSLASALVGGFFAIHAVKVENRFSKENTKLLFRDECAYQTNLLRFEHLYKPVYNKMMHYEVVIGCSFSRQSYSDKKEINDLLVQNACYAGEKLRHKIHKLDLVLNDYIHLGQSHWEKKENQDYESPEEDNAYYDMKETFLEEYKLLRNTLRLPAHDPNSPLQ